MSESQDRIEDKLERIDTKLSQLCEHITGNSDPSRGLLLRVHDVERYVCTRRRLEWIVITAFASLGAAGVAAAIWL